MLGDLVERLDSDDAVDLLSALPEEQARACSTKFQKSCQQRWNCSCNMRRTLPAVSCKPSASVLEGIRVDEAIEIIRSHIDEVSDIHNVFVVDQSAV